MSTKTLTKQQAEQKAGELIAKGEINRIYARKGSGALYQIKLIDPMLKVDSKEDWEVVISVKDLNPVIPNATHLVAEESLFYGTHIPTKN